MATKGKLHGKYGNWAVVTGASSGIGEEIATQLAGQGFDLVLVARRMDRLHRLAEALETKFGVEVKSFGVDLAASGAAASIDALTDDLDVGLLANNAGLFNVGEFTDQSAKQVDGILSVNVVSAAKLTQLFAKRFVARGRGGILLTASTMGYSGAPFAANYAASKNYVNALGEALHYELKPHGVDVTVLNPGPTRTEIDRGDGLDVTKFPLPVQSAYAVARAGLHGLGRKRTVIPGLFNRFMVGLGKFLPRRFTVDNFGAMIARYGELSDRGRKSTKKLRTITLTPSHQLLEGETHARATVLARHP